MAVTFTEPALRRVVDLLAEKPGGWFRVGIRGGGCSGLSYFLDVVDQPSEKDRRLDVQFEGQPVPVVVDVKSYLYLNGTEIDWHDDLTKKSFEFHNPNAKRSCSCGESFTV
jgi:iron-sulfur cluster assembly protein